MSGALEEPRKVLAESTALGLKLRISGASVEYRRPGAPSRSPAGTPGRRPRPSMVLVRRGRGRQTAHRHAVGPARHRLRPGHHP